MTKRTQRAKIGAQKFLSEKKVQSKCVAYARSQGYWARKLSSRPGNNSLPDYLFKRDREEPFAVEFKAAGKHSTEAQLEEQKVMREVGWTVYTDVDNFDDFKSIIAARGIGWLR